MAAKEIKPETGKDVSSGVMVTEVRIINFRCLRAAEASLKPTTLLIGENNAGKTSFLEALFAAIGSGQRQFTEDDIWTDTAEKHAPKTRAITIDLQLRPFEKGKVLDVFPSGSPWLELFGNGIVQDDNERDFVGIRTQYAWSAAKAEHVVERKFLKEWAKKLADPPKAKLVEKVPALTAAQTTAIALFLLDAKRDCADDIRTRGSVWNRLVSEPGLEEKDVAEIEKRLTEINSIFVSQSTVLSHLQGHLASVGDVVNCDKDGVSITPVARHLRDLHKGMDIVLSTAGASAFPLARQGMGTRSLASVLLFRAYMSWKMSKKKLEALHPFLAIEEPETHLHPHAQRSLFGQIQSIPGQKIISTHSPYVCVQADIRTFLHFGKSASETRITDFDSGEPLTPEDLRKINREVLNTRGDLLFSRFIVLFEGETEEQAIPDFASTHWGFHPHERGVSFVGVGGNGKYTPFLRLATRFDIPYCIFSDGTQNDIDTINGCLTKVGAKPYPENPNVFVIPSGTDFEGYLACEDNLDLLRDMITEFEKSRRNLNEISTAKCRENLGKKNAAAIANEMRDEKTVYGARIGAALAKHTDVTKRVPELVKNMLDMVRPVATRDGAKEKQRVS